VSSIGYLNDGYEGGEYVMPYQDIKFKPEAGDLIIHPSDFIYAHASLPVKKGVKFSAVTMYDYNDRNHQHHSPSSYGNQPQQSSISPLANGQVSKIS
jgi:predicted 2-oxoglutarate/Fe(II)-dependent dioxygenase YbiX